MEAGSRVCALLPLIMFSSYCSVPAPSSEGAVGEASACQDAFCDEDAGCPCAGPPMQPYKKHVSPIWFWFGLCRWGESLPSWDVEALQLRGCLVPEGRHWVPCWLGSYPIGSTSWLGHGPISFLQAWLVIITMTWVWVPFTAGPAILGYHGNAPIVGRASTSSFAILLGSLLCFPSLPMYLPRMCLISPNFNPSFLFLILPLFPCLGWLGLLTEYLSVLDLA